MQNFRLIQKNIDIGPFLTEISKNEKFWTAKRALLIPVQRETLSISLRKGVMEESKNLADCHGSEKSEVYGSFPLITNWVETFAQNVGELSRVMIVSLNPKGKVYLHTDKGEYYRIRDRYHLVLQSREGSTMISGNEKQVFQEGELWWFNNKEKHEVLNESIYPRIHLIFDVLPYDATKPTV